MAISLFNKPLYKKLLIAATSVLVVAGAAGGTILILKQYAPVKTTNTDSSEVTQSTTASLKKAEELFAKGDYVAAKSQYQNLLDTYKSQDNESAAKDIEMQIKVIDATAQAEKAPQNTDRTRVVAGSAAKEEE